MKTHLLDRLLRLRVLALTGVMAAGWEDATVGLHEGTLGGSGSILSYSRNNPFDVHALFQLKVLFVELSWRLLAGLYPI
uniref:Uncharacterized protein n=1 Tax=Rhizophora mucronata TaxID=61149 RepID=A0A2P2N5K5_RHIMU